MDKEWEMYFLAEEGSGRDKDGSGGMYQGIIPDPRLE
jgi:hypothetical protein